MKKIKSNQKIATIEFCYKSAAIPNVIPAIPILLNKLPEDFEIEILRHVPAGKSKLAQLFSVLERFSRITRTFLSNYSSEYSASVLLFQQNRET